MITLREYQVRSSDGILEKWKDHNSTLLCLPTGCGKTEVFAHIISRMQPQRSLVLAHREELIFQARNRIERSTGLHCEIEMGAINSGTNLFRSTAQAPVVVSTVQTQIAGCDGAGRMSKFDPMEFGVLIIDECHRSVSPSYLKVIEYYKRNPELRILGVTATPDRTDEEALGKVFESVAFEYHILDAIQDGWLVPIKQRMVHINGLDFSKIRTTAGDLNSGDLAAVMESEKNLQGVAGSSIEMIGGRRTLVFTASVAQAEKLCEIYNRHRAGMARWVCGKTNRDERREMLTDYSAGKIQVMVNCDCLSEGFDSPGVEVVIQAKPTKSRSKYAQQIGRATRPLAGVVDGPETPDLRRAAIAASLKTCCEVIDYVGNSGRHKLISVVDILGGKFSEDTQAMAVKKIKASAVAIEMTAALTQAELEIKQAKEARQLAADARRARLVADVNYSTRDVDPFARLGVRREASNDWEKRNLRQLSEKQCEVLKKNGIDPSTISASCGKKLIDKIFHHPTPGQAKVLKRFHYPLDCTAKQASEIIDALARNNWKRPESQEAAA